jgi:tRNA nucleotidyltransferase (CCA-adding enzyme)
MIADVRPELLGELGSRGSLDAAKLEDLPESLDLISARTEFYTHPTALPTVERGSIKLDLHRRDFTINTLALRLDGPHYGNCTTIGAVWRTCARVVMLRSLSFIDDPTRLLRAVRFRQRGFKSGSHLGGQARPLLERVSGDRVRHETIIFYRRAESSPLTRLQSSTCMGHPPPGGMIVEDRFDSVEASAAGMGPAVRWDLHPECAVYLVWLIHLPG